jgi:hypothetical protein
MPRLAAQGSPPPRSAAEGMTDHGVQPRHRRRRDDEDHNDGKISRGMAFIDTITYNQLWSIPAG